MKLTVVGGAGVMKQAVAYTLYWQFKKSMKSTHFNLPFFLLSRLLWPLALVATYYLAYTPLLDPSNPGPDSFSGGLDMFSYLIPGVVVTYIYLEYISIGFGLAVNRDYGILEPFPGFNLCLDGHVFV